MDPNKGDSTRGNEVVWQTKDMPRHVTSRIVVGLSNIVYFFVLDGNVEDYQSQMMFEYPPPSTFIGTRITVVLHARIQIFRRNWPWKLELPCRKTYLVDLKEGQIAAMVFLLVAVLD